MWAATTTCPSSTSTLFLFYLKSEPTHWRRRHYYYCNSCKYSSTLLVHNSSKFGSDSSSSAPKPKRGFGTQPLSTSSNSSNNNKAKKSATARNDEKLRLRKSSSQQSGSVLNQAPGITSPTEGTPKNIVSNLEFEEKLQAIRRSALEQKKAEEEKQFGVIDYDASVEPKSSTIGLGTKIGAGVAVITFGLVFALGDFLPSGSVSPSEESATVDKRISKEYRENLQKQMKQFEATLNSSPEDPTALEGAAVSLVELGEYKRAAMLLEDLTKKKPSDPDVFRLLGEVKYELKDYDGSAMAYRNAAKVSKAINFEVLRGLTDALLAARKPDEAVQILLASRERLSKEISTGSREGTEKIALETRPEMDPVQVDLLLGKAYSDWDHVSDAVSVYDQLISSHPDDFRGYLAKGILLKENGNIGDAERMFIQARFFAPEKAKALVDKYAR